MSLSDKFCVDRHKKNFLDLVKHKIDIVFSNEQEILSLIDSQNFNDAITFAKNIKKNLIITRGNKGAISINKSEVFECSAKENLNIKDLTGAGDLFAAGYLHGVINNLSIEESLAKGTELSSRVIQKIGARI
jgi:sugar/nucleoside kinase (ribokinase family)